MLNDVGRDLQNNWKRVSNVIDRLHDTASLLSTTAVVTPHMSTDTEVVELAFSELIMATNQLKLFVIKHTH